METTTNTVEIEKNLKEEGATLKMGFSQLGNKTPDWMSKMANGIIFLCMIWGLVSMGISSIPPDVKATINEWVLVSSGVIKLATKFFGLQLPQTEA